jgi:hypothetical protein
MDGAVVHQSPGGATDVMSHAEAALALSISERKLDEWVAHGRLTKRRLTDRTVGYLVREVQDLAESLPAMKPGADG